MVCLLLVWLPLLIHATFFHIHSVRKFSAQEKRTEKSYFIFWYSLFIVSRPIWFIWSISKNSKIITDLLNNLSNTSYNNYLSSSFPTDSSTANEKQKESESVVPKYYLWFFGITYLSLFILIILFFSLPGGQIDFPYAVFRSRISVVKKVFAVFTTTLEESDQEENSSSDTLVGLILTWFHIAYGLVNCISRVFLIGLYPITMWTAVKNFESFIESIKDNIQSPLMLQVIVNKFENLKEISGGLNNVFSKWFLVFIFEAFLQNVFLFDLDNRGSLNLQDLVDFLVMMITFKFQAIGLILSADVYIKV